MDEQPKRSPGRPRKEQGAESALPVKLLKAYWPEDGRAKQAKGAEIDLPAEEARMIVASGIAVRNDRF